MKRTKFYPKSQVVKNIGLVREIAHSFNRTTGIDFEELYGEALEAYIKAEQKYDKNKSKSSLNSYAWGVMRNRLIDYGNRKNEIVYEYQLPVNQTIPEPCYDFSFLFEFLDAIPVNCKILAGIVLNNRNEFIGRTPFQNRIKIREILKKKNGMSQNEAEGLIEDMKNHINSI